MDRAVFVYTTFPGLVEAEAAVKAILERRLAACANILPSMVSHYWWKGRLERAEEVVVIFKTRAGLADDLSASLRGLHPYEVPAIATLPVESMDRDYLAWLLAETETAAGRGPAAVS